ncbi:MAG: tetraacyldisaccharide 4'-kinase [Planctomycetota bacterium]|nr:tetraacyldisaccharide 4'-kinase [Planctomycetota bacterium]
MTSHPSTSSGHSTRPRDAWLAVVSGDRRGPAAALARCGLTVLAGLYRAAFALRDLWFRLPGAARRASRPVVSIGNLTVGGTGKTPMVAYLARLVGEMGGRPVILSRGYGSADGRPNEEAIELSRLCPGVPHLQNPDRLAALSGWLAGNPCDVAILDDGFQHRRMARNLDIVLIDALQPFGFGHVLPRGLLREPPAALRRADMVVITRAELSTPEGVKLLKQTILAHARDGTPILVARHEPSSLLMADGSQREAATLRGRDIAAACGIGNPDAFRLTLEKAGAQVRLFDTFPDHHAYTTGDLDRLLLTAEAAGLKTLVTTGKDFVKWQPLLAGRRSLPPVEVAALEVALQVLEGEETLRREIAALLHR